MTNIERAKEIINKINQTQNAHDVSALEPVILSYLQAAYNAGYATAFNQHANYKEDMGR